MKFKTFVFLSIVILPALSLLLGCGKAENQDGLNILVFSEMHPLRPESSSELTVGGTSIKIQPYPMVMEKLIVEIAAHSGDVYLVEEKAMEAIFDPRGLYPLEGLSMERQKYTGIDETGQERLFALSLPKDAVLLQQLGLKPTNDLVLFIPKFSEQRDIARSVLKNFKYN